MGYEIGKRFRFEAAHHLPGLPEGHKCGRPHGHSYTVEVVLTASELTPPGFVTDFADLAPFRAYLDRELDHRDLNEVVDFPPVSENLAAHLAAWFMTNVEPTIPGRLVRIRVSETADTWAEYTPDRQP
jgi:6-pyruvoyltetrahydropterin/6-carboxytetrahydropterin synthase